MKKLLPLLFAGLALLLAACGSNSGSTGADPYAPLDVDPPPPIEDPTITTSGTVSAKPGSPDLMQINVAGFLAPAPVEGSGLAPASAGREIPKLSARDFTVVEAGVVKGITIERIDGETRAAADVAFVFDTTGSMGGALRTVQDSIIEFVDHLDEAGLDVRVGAVTFGDAFDTKDESSSRSGTGGDTPPSLDGFERPTYQLTDDKDAFKEFIDGDTPRAGGDGPENAVGALAFAYDELEWRPGAQRVLIVITDIYSHNDETFTTFERDVAYDRYAPESPAGLLERIRGNAIVHVVSRDYDIDVEPYTDMAMFTGVEGTGGEFVSINDLVREDASLTDLDLTTATAGGYIVTFRGTKDGKPKDVRVVIDDGSDIRGEFTMRDVTY